MIAVWLEGHTPIQDGGLRINTDLATLQTQLSDGGWMETELASGQSIWIDTARIAAYQEEDKGQF